MATRAGLAAKRPAAVRSRSSAKTRISGQAHLRRPSRGWRGRQAGHCDLPSLIVPTPGFCACDDIGAAFAGVFWGVLVTVALDFGTSMVGGGGGGVVCGKRLKKSVLRGTGTYGAEMESIFLLRIGSDILAVPCCRCSGGGLLRSVVLWVSALQKCSAR
jgi:hypothetical protein